MKVTDQSTPTKWKEDVGNGKEDIVLRGKKPAGAHSHICHKEEAVITHKRGSDRALTPYEEVAVTFQAKSSNIKKSFPVTHHQLLREEDLSSPDSSDKEEEELEGEVGFEPLDKDAFDSFGQPLKIVSKQGGESEGSRSTLVEEEDMPGQPRTQNAPELDTSEVTSTGSDDTVIIHGEQDDLKNFSQPLRPPGHALLKEVAAVSGHHKSKVQEKQGPGEVFKELRGLSEAGGVQRLLNQMSNKRDDENGATSSTPELTAHAQPDLAVFKRGGVSEKLRLFGGKNEEVGEEEDTEQEDTVSPLPSIEIGRSSSLYQERLQIDGRSPETRRRQFQSAPTSNQFPRLSKSPTERRKAEMLANEDTKAYHPSSNHSPSRVKKMAAVYSPLLISSDARGPREEEETGVQKTSQAEEDTDSPHSLALYMNSANMAHLKQARQLQELKEREDIEQQVAALLEEPQLNGKAVPAAFADLDLSPGSLMVWKVKVRKERREGGRERGREEGRDKG